MQHRAKVSKVLDKLKANLRSDLHFLSKGRLLKADVFDYSKEQKANSELEYLTFYKVMSPIQVRVNSKDSRSHCIGCLFGLGSMVHNQRLSSPV